MLTDGHCYSISIDDVISAGIYALYNCERVMVANAFMAIHSFINQRSCVFQSDVLAIPHGQHSSNMSRTMSALCFA